MRGEHERYEQLAVGHVLGGLDADEAADFRTHLLDCRDCRSRVAELREMAADLAAAERDERARARVRTEVVRRDEESATEEPRARVGVRHVTAAVLVVVVLAAAMAFWNLHLRTATAAYQQVAGYRGETLAEIATGVSVSAAFSEGVGGVVVVDGEQVAFSLTGLPELSAGERLEVWLVGSEEGAVRGLTPIPAERLEDGRLAGHVDDRDADELVVTRERGLLGDTPAGAELVRAALDAPR